MPRIPRTVLAGLAALTVARLLISAFLPLGDDETFYWQWSRHLAAGYIDHPPAIAFLVWIATHLFGSTPFAVHAVAVFLSFVTSLILYVLSREVLGGDSGAIWSVVLFNITPVFAAGALLTSPDAPLGACWMLTLLWAWRAVGRSSGTAWLWAGLWLGLALESKYTAAVLPLCLALWLALSPAHRKWLRRPEPYYGLAVAAAVFAPVIWWNATHGWVSFDFNFLGRPSWSEGGNLPIFLGLQFVYLGPLLFLALAWALILAARRGLPTGADPWLFLAAAGLPVIGGMLAASVLGHVKGHWPAPGYIPAVIALAGIATEEPWAARSRLWRAAAATLLGFTAIIAGLIHALPPLAPYVLPPRLDPTVDYYGWEEAAQAISAIARRDARGPFFITTDRYQVMAQFDFNTGGRYVTTTITGKDQYGLWTHWAALHGEDALFILDGRYPPEVELNGGCRSIEVEPEVHIIRRGLVVRTLGLLWCRHFEGHPVRPPGAFQWAPRPSGPGGKLTR